MSKNLLQNYRGCKHIKQLFYLMTFTLLILTLLGLTPIGHSVIAQNSTGTSTEPPGVDTLVAATDTAIAVALASFTKTPTATNTVPTANAQTLVAATFAARATSTANAVASFTKTPTATPTNTPDTQQTIAAVVAATETQQAFLASIPTVTANNQWKPVIQTFDDVKMVLVPPGCYQMGSETGDSDEKPVTKICFDKPFWIDRTEVTNEQFAKFGGQAGRASNWTDPQRPRERITWLEARDYCAKRGARLPTEAEWEYAARGPDNLVYPWGNDFVADNVVYEVNSSGQTAEVGSKPSGASWVGALDLSGNVWEWTSSLYKPYPYSAADGRDSNSDTSSRRVLRGGSWNYIENAVRAADRGRVNPSFENNYLGFRCARS